MKTVTQTVTHSVTSSDRTQALVQTPLGNTGLNAQSFPETIPPESASSFLPETICDDLPQKDRKGWTTRLDWLQGCSKIPGPRLLEFLSKLAELTDDCWGASRAKPVFRGRNFETSSTSLRGGLIAYNCPDDNDMLDVWISLPGSVCGGLSNHELVKLLQLFKEYRFESTRVDLAIDDFDRQIQSKDLRDALESGDYAYFRDYEWVQSGSRSKSKNKRKLKPGSSFTGYLGSPRGDKEAYIYDKAAESNGDVMSIRTEVRFKDERSQRVIEILLSAEKISETIAEMVIGAIDFRDRAGDRRAYRCPRLSWWSQFVDSITPDVLKIPAAKRQLLLNAIPDWLNHQVSSSLAFLKDYWGDLKFDDFLDSLLANGRKRRSPRQQALLELGLG